MLVNLADLYHYFLHGQRSMLNTIVSHSFVSHTLFSIQLLVFILPEPRIGQNPAQIAYSAIQTERETLLRHEPYTF